MSGEIECYRLKVDSKLAFFVGFLHAGAVVCDCVFSIHRMNVLSVKGVETVQVRIRKNAKLETPQLVRSFE